MTVQAPEQPKSHLISQLPDAGLRICESHDLESFGRLGSQMLWMKELAVSATFVIWQFRHQSSKQVIYIESPYCSRTPNVRSSRPWKYHASNSKRRLALEMWKGCIWRHLKGKQTCNCYTDFPCQLILLIRLQSALIVCAQIELHRDWAASMEPLLIKSQHRRFSYNTYMCKINLEFATYLQLFIASERVGLGMGERPVNMNGNWCPGQVTEKTQH